MTAASVLAAGIDTDGFRWAVWRGAVSSRLIAEVTPPVGRKTIIADRSGRDELGVFVAYVLDEIRAGRVTGE